MQGPHVRTAANTMPKVAAVICVDIKVLNNHTFLTGAAVPHAGG